MLSSEEIIIVIIDCRFGSTPFVVNTEIDLLMSQHNVCSTKIHNYVYMAIYRM